MIATQGVSREGVYFSRWICYISQRDSALYTLSTFWPVIEYSKTRGTMESRGLDQKQVLVYAMLCENRLIAQIRRFLLSVLIICMSQLSPLNKTNRRAYLALDRVASIFKPAPLYFKFCA